MTGEKLRVAVVGGGIGGLSAALFLRGAGIDAQVYEQAAALGEIGAGVLMTPNSVRLLERRGLGKALGAKGARVGIGSTYYRADGTAVAPILTTDSTGWNGMYGMHRADLIGLLADALGEGVVHTGHQCVGFGQSEGQARVLLAGGETVDADVVIAADGIHSTLQKYVTQPTKPKHSGSTAYRGLVSAAELDWPQGISQLWMGEGKHFLVYPVRSGELINYVGFVPSDEEMSESWSAPGDPDRLRADFAGWDPRVQHLLSRVTETFWWGLYDREPLDTWTIGRLTLLGDAAHPMLPHLGQGANQSIEDGVALAAALGGVSAAEAPAALLHYEQVRRLRTAHVQGGARDNGRRYDSSYDDLAVRDAEIAASARFRAWLYDYDVEAHLGLVDAPDLDPTGFDTPPPHSVVAEASSRNGREAIG